MERSVTDKLFRRWQEIILGFKRCQVMTTEEAQTALGGGDAISKRKTISLVRQICDAHGLVFHRWKSATGPRGFIIYEQGEEVKLPNGCYID